MMKLNYAQQIKHPEWQRKRLEVLEAHGFECEDCGSKEEELHVHHPYYKRGAMIWQYETHDLQCLCHKCHKDAHAKDEEIKQLVSDCGREGKEELIGVLKAMNDGPWIKLNSHEEIVGYLSYRGVRGKLLDSLVEVVIKANGKPHNTSELLHAKTSYHDIADTCFKQPPSLSAVLISAAKTTKKRMESYSSGGA
jgi:hypothetical protein